MNKKNKFQTSTDIIDAVIEKMFFDLGTETDLSQGWIFIWGKRYSREAIIVGLYHHEIDIVDFLLHMNIFHPNSIDEKMFDDLLLRLAQMYVSKEFIEDTSEVQYIITELKSKIDSLHPDVESEVVRTKNIFSKLFK